MLVSCMCGPVPTHVCQSSGQSHAMQHHTHCIVFSRILHMGIFFLLLCQCKAMQTITQPALRSRTPRMWTFGGGGGGTGQAASAMQYTVMQSAMSRSEWQSAPTSYTLMLVGRVAWCGCSFIMDLGHHAIRPTNPTRGGVIGSVGSDGLQPTLAPSNTPSRRLDATISLDTHESIIHSVSYLHSASKHVGCYYTIHNWQPW